MLMERMRLAEGARAIGKRGEDDIGERGCSGVWREPTRRRRWCPIDTVAGRSEGSRARDGDAAGDQAEVRGETADGPRGCHTVLMPGPMSMAGRGESGSRPI